MLPVFVIPSLSMKFLHTADWHIGNTLYGYDRADEHEAAFAALADIVGRERPDVMLVSGDIFHNPQPSASAQTALTDAILKLRAAAPDMAVVIIAGNHDSASRHEIFSRAWRRLGVYAVGSPGADDASSFEKMIVELPGIAYVVAVPYLYGRTTLEGLFGKLLDEVARRNGAGLPVLAMAHAMVAFGSLDLGREYRGADEPVDGNVFGSGYDYLALGHIHRPSGMPGMEGRVRYSGSLLPVNFDEDYEHSVVIGEIDEHGGRLDLKRVALPCLRPVVSLPRRGFSPWSVAIEELRQYATDGEAYVRLCLSRDEEVPATAAEDAERICVGKGLRFCLLAYPPVDFSGASGDTRHLSVEEFKQMTPAEVATMHAERWGLDFDDELRALFDEIVAGLDKEAKE